MSEVDRSADGAPSPHEVAETRLERAGRAVREEGRFLGWQARVTELIRAVRADERERMAKKEARRAR